MAIINDYLDGYPEELRLHLVDGFKHGFPWHFSEEHNAQNSHNLKSVLNTQSIVRAKLNSELEAGRMAGPSHPNLKISPLGVVPKRQEGQLPLVHNVSFPRATGLSWLLVYFMVKTDIKSAFCLLPVHPND